MYDHKVYGRNVRLYYGENYGPKAYGVIFTLTAKIGSYRQYNDCKSIFQP